MPPARAADLNARFPGDASKTSIYPNALSADDSDVSVDHKEVFPQNKGKHSLTQVKYKDTSKTDLRS